MDAIVSYTGKTGQSKKKKRKEDPLRAEDVRIFRPCKSAMQSGKGKVVEWVLTFKPQARETDALVGWTASRNTQHQLELRFPRLETAIEYAKQRGWGYTVDTPEEVASIPKSYADNFTLGRVR